MVASGTASSMQTEKTGKREPIADPVLYLLVDQVVEGL